MAESIRYTQRTADEIRDELIALIPEVAPSWTSHGSDDPGIALVELLAGVADSLHYYLDKQALENYITTVKLRKNAIHLSHLVGYRPRRAIASEGTIQIGATSPLTHQIFIPAGTQLFTKQGSIGVVTKEDVQLDTGFSGTKTIEAVQGEVTTETFSSKGGTLVELTLSSKSPSEQLFRVSTYDQEWVEFRDAEPEDASNRWYHFSEDYLGNVSLRFLGTLGNTPMVGTPIKVRYVESSNLSLSAATQLSTPGLTEPDGLTTAESTAWNNSLGFLTFTANNVSGYKPKESVEKLRYSAPKSVASKRRAIEEEDYVFLSRQVAGVRDIKVVLSDFYAREVVVHVLGDNITTVPQTVLDNVRDYLNERNELALSVSTVAATIQNFVCTVDVKSASGYSDAAAVYAVKTALNNFFNGEALDFGRTIRLGEVYAEANRLAQVDYVNVTALYLEGGAVSAADLVPSANTEVLHISDNLTVNPI